MKEIRGVELVSEAEFLIMRENMILVPGPVILFFLTRSLGFQPAPRHRSRDLMTSHTGGCQELPQRGPAQRACGDGGEGERGAVGSHSRPHARLEAPDVTEALASPPAPC